MKEQVTYLLENYYEIMALHDKMFDEKEKREEEILLFAKNMTDFDEIAEMQEKIKVHDKWMAEVYYPSEEIAGDLELEIEILKSIFEKVTPFQKQILELKIEKEKKVSYDLFDNTLNLIGSFEDKEAIVKVISQAEPRATIIQIEPIKRTQSNFSEIVNVYIGSRLETEYLIQKKEVH